ncbi:PLP-dependent aminotransferase family protein [Streptomyces sp. NPDC052396]|uniref:MocR-like pyridoxine biosynthesis transcription factor PdxR n=1 Tax=Streptomyces sp. NPDC052396 TaxID=3365689 RepID=UPI0037CD3E96
MGDTRTNPPPGHGWTAAWELLLPAAGAPARRRGHTLCAALRVAVRSGRLAPGTRLPPSRELARDLGVSRGLITSAYEQLTAEGYLKSTRGAGTWVGGAIQAPAPAAPENPAPDHLLADFRPGTPDLALFPRTAWSAAQRRALTRLPHHALGYPDPRGLPELRAELAALLARRRGVAVDPGRIVVCSGVAQALTLLGLVLAGRQRGRPLIAVENPGSPEHEPLFTSIGCAVRRVPVDAEGMDPAALAASGARAAVLTPAHQFPTGIAYSAHRRAALLHWARTTGALLVEDDYDGDFRYDRQPIGALQGLDPEHVAYTGSVSKSLAPALRLGWLVPPESYAGEVVARKRTMDMGHPVLDQALLAEFTARGDLDRQLRRCQRAYRERRDALLAALDREFPGAEVTGVAAGLHAVVRLPRRYGPQPRFLARATAHRIALRPLSDYGAAVPGDGGVHLVLGYAHLPPARLMDSLHLLRRATRP